ncbi:MAG: NADH-quinone oxidoreductase subunit NuoH [Chloroflexia bacterium]|nr:NADH-quinone oxidoreductase subunit NuoH [Chloroflexia bacterium]
MELLIDGLNNLVNWPEWLIVLVAMLIVITFILLFGPLVFMLMTWLLRRGIARFADRLGPNRVGLGRFNQERTRQKFPLWGLLQPVADGVKMFTKEDIIPQGADVWLHRIAPVAALVPSFMMFAVIPFGKDLVGADLDTGLVYLLAVSSLMTLVLLVAGWASNNKYSLLGGMRTAAQMISYEIPMVLSLVVPIILVNSISLDDIIIHQGAWLGLRWHILWPMGLVAFITYFTAALAEVNHTPFDLPEADSELVAGYHTEYSGMKFALFFMGEFINQFLICAIATIVFLGGWQGPGVQLGGVWGYLFSVFWFFAKTFALYAVLIWIRGTWPRLRIDQLMDFAWKRLVPISLGNILITGVVVIVYNTFFG